MTNRGTALPVRWKIPRVAHFECKPRSGTLHPGQSTKLLVTFRPAQLGKFKHEMSLQVEDGAMEKNFRVMGHADQVDESLRKTHASGTKVGGPTSIPADFKPRITFVDENALKEGIDGSTKPWRRIMPWEETLTGDSQAAGGGGGGEMTVADSQYTFSVPDLLRRQAHRDQYHAYLKDARNHRLRQDRERDRRRRGLADSDDPNSVDMGMQPRSGLRPPVPQLPEATDPLWLEQPLTEDGGAPKRRVKLPSDEKRLIKHKFKPRATTPAEVRDVDCELSQAQLRDLAAGPTSINFGKVVVHSSSTRSFFVANNLNQSVLVALQPDGLDEELQRSTPLSQLIPPGELAGFDITFCSRSEQPYRRTLQYMVNDRHNFKFNVQAEVVPITLQLSDQEINFRFSQDSLEPTCTERITIRNPGNAPCTYKWSSGRGGVFMASPKHGSVEAYGEEEIAITWQPVPKGVKEDVLRLQVEGGRGAECSLKVSGEATDAKLVFKEKELDFGGLAVGIPVERTVVVKNTSKGGGNPTAFYAESPAPGITVKPERGFIGPGQSRELTVVCKPPREYIYKGAQGNSVVLCRPRGGRPAAIEVLGEAVVPEVHVLEEEIEFGGVTIGATMRQPLRLENRGTIPAVLFIDLERHPEFSVEMDPKQLAAQMHGNKDRLLSGLPGIDETKSDSPTKKDDNEEERMVASLIPVTDIRVDLNSASTKGGPGGAPSSAATTTRAASKQQSRGGGRVSSSRASEAGTEGDDFGANEIARKFKATIPVGECLQLLLLFAPQSERSHVFELPLILAGQHQRRAPESLQRVISAEGLRPRVYLSRTTIDFSERVVSRDRSILFPYHLEFTLTNRDEVDISWEADTSGMLPGMMVGGMKQNGRPTTSGSTMTSSSMASTAAPAKPTFTMTPDRGELEPGEACTVKVSFWPDCPGEFEADMPIFLDGNTERPYITVRLKGEGIYPKLSFDVGEVVMPPVPLGVESRARFVIINTGYDQLELEHAVPLDSSHVPLEVSYPEGKEIGMARNMVPIDLTFMSRKAMAFTCRLDFLDSDGNRFTIAITGAADNCLLTTQDSLVGSSGLIGYGDKELGIYAKNMKAPQLYPNEQVRRLTKEDMKASGSKESEIDQYELEAVEFSKKMSAASGKKQSGVSESPTRRQRSKLQKEKQQRVRQANEALRSWLNSSVMRTPIERIPHDFVEKDGKPLFSLIEMLTGRAVPKGDKNSGGQYPGASRISGTGNRMLDAAKNSISQYDAVLAHIKSHGALVNHVRPEILSKRKYFVAYTLDKEIGSGLHIHRLTPSQELARKNELQREWKRNSAAAWASVLYQVIKCYVLNRVTPQHYAALPGVDHSRPTPGISEGEVKPSSAALTNGDAPVKPKRKRRPRADPALSGSNVYSVSEGVLLKWLTYHYSAMVPSKPKRITTFDRDLRDGSVLCSLLQSHLPALAQQGRPLYGYARAPETEEHIRQNAERVVAAMRDLGLELPLSPNRICAKPVPDARDMLLVVLYLYQNLPQYLPRTSIEFSGVLGQTIVKSIELRNPSTSTITYYVTIEGSPDFTIDTQTLELEPQATVAYSVEFTSRFSSEVTARLMFRAQSNGGGGVTAATMVFELKSAVHSRRAMRTVNVDAKCYESSFVELEVSNPFKTDCNYRLTMTQDMLLGTVRDKKTIPAIDVLRGKYEQNNGKRKKGKKGKKKGGKKGPGGALDAGSSRTLRGHPGANATPVHQMAEEVQDSAFPLPFWCRNSTVKVKAGQTAKLQIQFLPLKPGNYRCQLVLLDEKVGECMYEVLGTASMPNATDTLKIVTEMSGSVTRVMKLFYPNPLVEKARALAMERFSGSSLKKMRDALKTYNNSQKRPMIFSVEFDSPFFNGPSEVTVTDGGRPVTGSSAGGKKKKNGSEEEVANEGANDNLVDPTTNGVMIQFAPQQPGEYPARMILRSPLEVRVFDVLAVVKTPQKKRMIDFEAPAREVIVQEIPIVNKSGTDWTITAAIRGEGSRAFQGGKSVKVPHGSEGSYKLKYRPDWVTDTDKPHSAQLTLSNATTGEDYIFDLKGTAEEPLAEDHVSIPCQARQRMVHKFRVKNTTSKPQVYSVESDLTAACGVSGVPSIEVPPKSHVMYELVLRPLLGGQYNGSITFTGPDGAYQWYTVEIDATPAAPEQTLDLQSMVRRAISVEIALENPLKDDAVEFDVALQGEGLLGDSQFSLGPKETATYELLFAPLLPGNEIGSIVFSNSKLGEVWYELNLFATEPQPVALKEMKCAVGTKIRQKIFVENPSSEEITLQCTSTNTLNFRVVPGIITLPPYGKTAGGANTNSPSKSLNSLPVLEVEYAPSSLDQRQDATLILRDPSGNVSNWEFLVSGRGDAPSVMEPVVVYSAITVRASSTFSFRNPFPEDITVRVEMKIDAEDSEKNSEAFTLLLKHPLCKIVAFGSLQIPFIFVPNAISEYNATVIIERPAGDTGSLCWQYPIRGVAEAPPTDDGLKIISQVSSNFVICINHIFLLVGMKQ